MSSSSGPLTEELQCSVCLDVFTDPVTTPCGHNFCRTCLNKCWDNSQTCSCPYCKETFRQRPDLKINTTLREIADHYKKKSPEQKPEVLCDFCEDRKLKALKSCLVCQSSYCETHLEPHLKVTGLKKHKLMDPVRNLEDYICQKHERPLEFYCRDDQTCVCSSCTEGDHKNHNTVSLEKESQEKKTQLMKTQKDVQQKIQDVKHAAEARKVGFTYCDGGLSQSSRSWHKSRTAGRRNHGRIGCTCHFELDLPRKQQLMSRSRSRSRSRSCSSPYRQQLSTQSASFGTTRFSRTPHSRKPDLNLKPPPRRKARARKRKEKTHTQH